MLRLMKITSALVWLRLILNINKPAVITLSRGIELGFNPNARFYFLQTKQNKQIARLLLASYCTTYLYELVLYRHFSSFLGLLVMLSSIHFHRGIHSALAVMFFFSRVYRFHVLYLVPDVCFVLLFALLCTLKKFSTRRMSCSQQTYWGIYELFFMTRDMLFFHDNK